MLHQLICCWQLNEHTRQLSQYKSHRQRMSCTLVIRASVQPLWVNNKSYGTLKQTSAAPLYTHTRGPIALPSLIAQVIESNACALVAKAVSDNLIFGMLSSYNRCSCKICFGGRNMS